MARGWAAVVAVCKVEGAVVLSAMVETGPRSAAALSRPDPRPPARPALGAANGSAGLTKLVTPGAAAGPGTAGAGLNVCTGAAAVTGAAALTAATGGAANMLITGAGG
ncbi:MAG: hypothetical protein JO259_12215 [Mycobacterium sp.]|nr:hypothetical protein [Mycobacterium sp.]